MLAKELESLIAPMRERYIDLMAKPDLIEDVLLDGAKKARAISEPFIREIRQAVGLRTFHAIGAGADTQSKKKESKKSSKLPRFVSFKDDTGQFMFRLISTDGEELLRSVSFPNPKIAGQAIKTLQNDTNAIQFKLHDGLYQLSINEQLLAIAVDESKEEADNWKAKFLNQLSLFNTK